VLRYPKILSTYELMRMSPDDQAAIDYLAGILWPDGPVCPHCKGKRITTLQRENHSALCGSGIFVHRTGLAFSAEPV